MIQLPRSETLTVHTDGAVYYSFPHMDAYPFIRNGFSTRLGGVSNGVYASMNLSYTRGDDRAAVDENFSRICKAMGVSAADAVLSAQEHHTRLRNVTAADRGIGFSRPAFSDVDGLLTDEPQVVLCTQYADCVPLLFADPQRRVVAAAHAGWRGTVAEIGRLTVERMESDYGCDPHNILVGIAPSIGACCFEVDAAVAAEFEALAVTDGDTCRATGNGKFFVDLWETNRRSLLTAGVRAEHVTVTDLCTRCHPQLFWSHRYSGAARGSLAAFIALEK